MSLQAQTLALIHTPQALEGRKESPPLLLAQEKRPGPRKSPELKGTQGDPVALGKWVRRQSHKTIPVAQKGVSFQGSHPAWLPAQLKCPPLSLTAMSPADPSLAADTVQSLGNQVTALN